MNLTFERVYLLWGLLVVPLLVIAFSVDELIRRRTLEQLGHLPQMRRMVQSLSPGRKRLKMLLVAAAAGLLVVGVAGPQVAGSAHILPRRGLDIVVALDFSRSMLAADVYPSRLERAKAELNKLIDGLKGDRVGLVAFAGVTMSYPLTNDYAAAKLFWRDLSPADLPVGGTDLGQAVRDGLALLESGARKEARTGHRPAQVIVLLTDGDDTEGAALQAVREATQKGVKIFTVGIGSSKGEYVTLARHDDGTVEYLTDAGGKPVRMVLDVATLRQMAQATGGDYFQLDPERFGVMQVQRAIADLERIEEEARVVKEPEEAYAPWFLPAFLLLLVEGFIGDRRRPGATPMDKLESGTGPRTGTIRSRRSSGMVSLLPLVLLGFLPGLTAFNFFERPSPEVEEGKQLLSAGKAEEALAAFDRALQTNPEDLAIHYDRGAALYALGKFPEAQREFLRASQSPEIGLKADSYYNMGNTLMQQQKPKDSIDAYKRTLNLRPGDRLARWNLELAQRQMREQEQKKQQQAQQGQPDQQNQQKKDQQQDQKDHKDQQGQENNQQEQQAQQQQKPDNPQDPQPGQKQDQQQSGRENNPGQQAPQPQKDPQAQPQPQKDPQAQPQQQKDPQAQPQPPQKDQQEKQQQNNQQSGQGTQKEKDQQAQQSQAKQQSQKDQKDQPAQKSDGQKPGQPSGKPDAKELALAKGDRAPRDTDRQDAEAVLDAFEAVEPTVQKDLARRKGGDRRPKKDW